VKNRSDDDKEPEEKKLHHQTANNDVGACLASASIARCHESTTGGLKEKREDIARDEDLGHPADTHEA
jgi:hypothetical protein